MTVDAVLAQTKPVTRRHVDTWKTLKPGDQLTLIEKGMGLRKGEKQVILAEVVIVDVRVEPIRLMTSDIAYGRQEVVLEGLPHMTPEEFVAFWLRSHGYRDGLNAGGTPLPINCRRIEWRYLIETPKCAACGASYSLPIGMTCGNHRPEMVWV